MVLKILFPGANPIRVDIVLVHGLGPSADPKKTWEYKGFRWPRDGLPVYQGLDSSRIRVLSFGYNNDPATLFPSVFPSGLVNTARALLTEIDQKRRGAGDDKRPVIFVAHNVGGLVVKQALVLSRRSPNSNGFPKLATIASATIGAVFLGTPQRFSSKAGWVQTANNLTNAIALNPSDANAIASGFNELATLESAFNAEIATDIAIFSFHEGKKTSLTGGSDFVVDQLVATTGTPGEHPNELMKIHQDMPKLKSRHDNDYSLVAGAIFDVLGDYENGQGPAVKVVQPGPRQPDPRFPDYQNGPGPLPPSNTGAPGQIVQTTLFPTGNICGDPNCGRTRICAADFNRRVKPMGYPGV